MRTAALAALAAAACGRLGYDPVALDAPPAEVDALDAPIDAAGTCPAGYTPLDGSCYRFSPVARTWTAAEADCEADGPGSHLVTVTRLEEHNLLHDLGLQGGATHVWIGYTDRRAEGVFRWVSFGGIDPEIDQCLLGPAFPNSAAVNCVRQLSETGICIDWDVVDCDQAEAYVCEHDGYSADPTAF